MIPPIHSIPRPALLRELVARESEEMLVHCLEPTFSFSPTHRRTGTAKDLTVMVLKGK